MSPRRVWFVCAWALVAALGGCKKSEEVACDPPVNPTCPSVVPSFANDVLPRVFVPYCQPSCHSPGGVESNKPFTTYQQVYGQNGFDAGQILRQVFDECLMPPSNAPAQLTDGAEGDGGDDAGSSPGPRQTLLDWLICGAMDN